MKKTKVCLVVLFVLFLSSCATCKTCEMLNSRLGQMTYEEALQRFGPPAQCAESGETKTCTWVHGTGGAVFMPMGYSVFAVPIEPPSARLTFTNGVLSYWYLTGNWK